LKKNTSPEYLICFSEEQFFIEKKYQHRIFDMFFRGTVKSDGSGLGLFIVRQTIERLGGNISLESDIGKGTKFTIVLPNLTPQVAIS
jgi:signal transduction histidine kinase